MLFLSLSNIDVKFVEKLKKFTWRSYIVTDVLSTTSQVELINKRKFARTALDENFETFVIYVATLEIILIYNSRAS